VGVSYNDTSDDARSFARRYGLGYRLVRDCRRPGLPRLGRQRSAGDVRPRWGGRAVAHFYGAIDATPAVTDAFRRAIDEARAA
jgi:hypothetical protein